MNQDFIDYEASYITPQKTLLKKQNEILKYLRNTNQLKLYKHLVSFTDDSNNVHYLEFIDNSSTKITEINSTGSARIANALSATYSSYNKIMEFRYSPSPLKFVMRYVYGSVLTTMNIVRINTDTVEEY